MNKPAASAVLALLVDAIDDAVNDAIKEELMEIRGVDIDLRFKHLQHVKSHVALTIMAALRAAEIIGDDPYRPAPATLSDSGLLGNLKEGFDEGREPRHGTQTPSPEPKPEEYEQLTLPGLEDY